MEIDPQYVITSTEKINEAIARTSERLQNINDSKAVSKAVYGFLRAGEVDIPEEGSEALCGMILGFISRARAGKDMPTNEEILEDLAGRNKHAAEHNAEPRLKTKLHGVDMDVARKCLESRVVEAD